MDTLADQLDGYLGFLEHEKRCTPTTLKNYSSTLRRFVSLHTTLDVESTKTFLRAVKDSGARNTYLVRLRGFAKYLDISLNKVPRSKEVVKPPDALVSGEVHRLCESSFALDFMLGHGVTLLSQTGLRIHEFYALTKESLESVEGYHSLLVLGKGQKIRRVPLSPDAFASFTAMTFPFPISAERFRRLLLSAGQSIGKEVRPHLLRASCASIMINERRVDSAVVAPIMGWAKIDTMVKHYYRPSAAILQEAVNQ